MRGSSWLLILAGTFLAASTGCRLFYELMDDEIDHTPGCNSRNRPPWLGTEHRLRGAVDIGFYDTNY